MENKIIKGSKKGLQSFGKG